MAETHLELYPGLSPLDRVEDLVDYSAYHLPQERHQTLLAILAELDQLMVADRPNEDRRAEEIWERFQQMEADS